MEHIPFKVTREFTIKCTQTSTYDRVVTESEMEEDLEGALAELGNYEYYIKEALIHGLDDYDPNNKKIEITGRIVDHD